MSLVENNDTIRKVLLNTLYKVETSNIIIRESY